MSEFDTQTPDVVTIETERLQLKTVVMEDLDDMLPIMTDLRVMQWSSKPPVENEEQATRWMRTKCFGRSTDLFNFAIREKAIDGTPQKVVGIMGFSQEPGTVGYMMNADYAGRGYATEALRALIPAFFARTPPASEGGTGVDAVTAYIDTRNAGSQRVLEKSGFTRCEYLTDQGIHVQDNPHNKMSDSWVYRIARPGKTLEELGLIPGRDADEPPEPPVQ